MAKQSPDPEHGGKSAGAAAFGDLKKAIAERNEQAHKAASELRAAREREQLGIVARRRLDLDR
jgi:hypothetical protein